MKKKRGLKRYYRNLGDYSFLENLDFSGGNNSWFDFYHFHIDNTGLGNKSWKSRKQHLDALFKVTEKIEGKLRNYSKDFQYWIAISENDSYDDSIYIHTQNPNGSEFPVSIVFDNKKSLNTNLTAYLAQKGYNIQTKMLLDFNEKEEINFFLTKNDLGLKIE
ncbi:MAG: hypothetical protein HRT66_03805 [Flavobacteriaceae bacterium]|nr:hypothetical protein [Flavobacteriaceae bacterium]